LNRSNGPSELDRKRNNIKTKQQDQKIKKGD